MRASFLRLPMFSFNKRLPLGRRPATSSSCFCNLTRASLETLRKTKTTTDETALDQYLTPLKVLSSCLQAISAIMGILPT